MRTLILKLKSDTRGVTLVEYGIAIVLGVLVGVGTLSGLATTINGEMDEACSVMDSATC